MDIAIPIVIVMVLVIVGLAMFLKYGTTDGDLGL